MCVSVYMCVYPEHREMAVSTVLMTQMISRQM